MNQIISLSSILAQAGTPQSVQSYFLNLIPDLFNLVKALVILLIGWLIAGLVRSLVVKLLNQTSIDNRIASWISSGRGDRTSTLPIEKWIGEGVFWLIVLFTIIAALNALQLTAVSAPLNSLLEQVTTFLPKVAGAGLILGFAWIVATIVKLIVSQAFDRFRVDERLGQQIREPGETQQLALGETIASALYWFVFLLFLPAILSTLQLEGSLGPVQGLLNDILAMVPNILGAVLIGVVGWFLAQIVRRIVTNLLMATGIDNVGRRFGLSRVQGSKSLSWIIGTVVYVFILIPTAIEALNKLQIQSISQPGINMLNQVLNILPQIFAALVVLIFAYIAGRYVADLVTQILTGFGFNNVFRWLGISLPEKPASDSIPDTMVDAADATTRLQLESDEIPHRTPSELAGVVTLVGIMLVAALTAVDILQIEALKAVVGTIMVIAGRVFLALIIFAIGLYLANLAFNLIASSGTRQGKILGQSARISIIILVGAMALQQMGIAPDIVNLAFGLLLGGIAVAIAIAFGLGGREIAAEQIREWLNSFKNN